MKSMIFRQQQQQSLISPGTVDYIDHRTSIDLL